VHAVLRAAPGEAGRGALARRVECGPQYRRRRFGWTGALAPSPQDAVPQSNSAMPPHALCSYSVCWPPMPLPRLDTSGGVPLTRPRPDVAWRGTPLRTAFIQSWIALDLCGPDVSERHEARAHPLRSALSAVANLRTQTTALEALSRVVDAEGPPAKVAILVASALGSLLPVAQQLVRAVPCAHLLFLTAGAFNVWPRRPPVVPTDPLVGSVRSFCRVLRLEHPRLDVFYADISVTRGCDAAAASLRSAMSLGHVGAQHAELALSDGTSHAARLRRACAAPAVVSGASPRALSGAFVITGGTCASMCSLPLFAPLTTTVCAPT